MTIRESLRPPVELTLWQRFLAVNWLFVGVVLVIVGIGFAMLYSIARGTTDTWVLKQSVRFVLGAAVMFAGALTDFRFFYRYAYPIYAVALALLVAVDIVGHIGMGAQRWVSVGAFNIQPSELMKIALVLALAKYFHTRNEGEVGQIRWLIVPLLMIAAPIVLVLRQPDLGTAALLGLCGVTVLFLAGVRLWMFIVSGGGLLAALPLAWEFLHDYQKNRVFTFFDPERDPLGAGYHIIQSKIALGSGGTFGKGFMQGTQSHLNFLPEKQTDFIFTVYAEEFGLVGGLFLLFLYFVLIANGVVMAQRIASHFGRLVAMSITTVFFFYIFINVAMVMGLIPIVGVPLPLFSYGGTALVSILAAFGILICAHTHRDVRIPRRPGSSD
ncbi:MAG: rod shape-determining protein RodA [Alphaproteobacteria bacterium]|nr:rod shape-determining protein RodA [Alphaproteobacteria bacterium]